jgi:hypothetical protein
MASDKKKRAVVWAAMLLIAVAIAFVLATRGPELLVINPDPGAVRPRKIVVLNPLRDRRPEALADRVLRQLAAGELELVRPFFGANRDVMVDAEHTYRPREWQIGAREDDRDYVRLMYWVSRTGGYAGEEEAWFELKLVGSEWQLVSYNAVY